MKKVMNVDRSILRVLGALLLIGIPAAARAQAPNMLTYQGRLKDNGILVSGNRSIELYLCPEPSASCAGGVTTGVQLVAVTNGVFRTTFSIPSSVNLASGDWYLQARVYPGPTTLVPSEKLTSSPYAMQASSAATLMAAPGNAGAIISTHVFIMNGGNLGVGTLSAAEKLTVAGNVKVSNLAGTGNRCVYADSFGVLRTLSSDCGLASPTGDGMGNHTATQNITLGNNWISPDGSASGLRLDSSGNVGVGTPNPQANLDVNGTLNVGGIGGLSVDTSGNVGVGTPNPQAKLDVNGALNVSGALKVGGSETGVAASDIKAYFQKGLCELRRGVWSDGSGCREFAYYTPSAGGWYPACSAGYHLCTFVDLYAGGLLSLFRPGSSPSGSGYVWIGGTYSTQQDRMFYPWGSGTDLACAGGSHYVVWLSRGSPGNTAWGCYMDSFSANSACCRDDQ